MDAQTHSRNLLTAVQKHDPDAAGVAIAGLLEQPVTDKHKELARLFFFLISGNTKWAQISALDWVMKLPGSAVVMGAVTGAIDRLKNNGALTES